MEMVCNDKRGKKREKQSKIWKPKTIMTKAESRTRENGDEEEEK